RASWQERYTLAYCRGIIAIDEDGINIGISGPELPPVGDLSDHLQLRPSVALLPTGLRDDQAVDQLVEYCNVLLLQLEDCAADQQPLPGWLVFQAQLVLLALTRLECIAEFVDRGLQDE